jgi:hypothetical protein
MSSKTNNPNIVNVNPQVGEDSPAVLAYRVGELEKASREGFKDLSNKLEIMSKNFATHKDIEVAKEQAKMEHDAIYAELEDIRDDVNSLKKKTWIQNTLSAVFGAVLALLTAYAFNGIFTG